MKNIAHRTRFAPSPTGELHIGSARTAIFNWLLARASGGKFILRIEDTDKKRGVDKALQGIFPALHKLGLDWDEGGDLQGEKAGKFGPYFQSQRQKHYDEAFEKLRAVGKVYKEKGAWRFNFTRGKNETFFDLIHGEIKVNLDAEPDITIRRPDGSYVFHFCNVVDDILMRISCVLRGDDHLANTAKHLQIYRALGVEPPTFAHMPLTLNADGSKMSKRERGATLQGLFDEGFHPEGIFNYLCLLGWSPKSELELFSRKEAIELFSLAGINKANARFDIEKCAWFSGQYIHAEAEKSVKKIIDRILEVDKETGEFAKLLKLAKAKGKLAEFELATQAAAPKTRLLCEFTSFLRPLFSEDFGVNLPNLSKNGEEKLQKFPDWRIHLQVVMRKLEDKAVVIDWNSIEIKSFLKNAAAESQIKFGKLFMPLRLAVTRKSGGIDLLLILEILGRQQTCLRLRALLRDYS